MTWTPAENSLLGQAIADTSATQKAALGTIVKCKAPDIGVGEFIYLQGVASTAVGSLASYKQDDFSTTLATADDAGSVAVAMSACVASNYGWYQITGKASVKVLTGFADNADCYLTSTAGSIDDAVVSGDLLQNMRGASAISGGLADIEIDRPHVQDGELLDSVAITSSAAELNILDGVTAVAAELNYLDLTGAVGTQEASKAVVADANVNTGVSKVTELHVGATGSEVQVVATPLEINRANDVSARMVAGGASLSLTLAAHDGKTILMDDAAGTELTLPAAAGTGARFRVLVSTTVTSSASFLACAGSDYFVGHLDQTRGDDDTVISYPALAGDTFDIITLDGTTTGGIIGDWIEVEDIASGIWALKASTNASGTVAIPLTST